MKGVFGLNSNEDLLKKLEWEYETLLNDIDNPFIAYNFFVTAWHLLEWTYPDPKGVEIRNRIRDINVLLQICEHIAVGAKHFVPTNKSLKSVASSDKNGFWAKDFWAPNFWAKGAWATWLEVKLEGKAAERYGSVIKVPDLAKATLIFWREFRIETYTK